MQKIELTQTVQKGGCAAKVAASELRKILSQVRFPAAHAELLVDGGLFDDAAIYKINSEIALVQTLDFFTPIVDTPRLFGRIAAANALSDVYAMGGKPKTALGILAFPIATMPEWVIVDVMQGASDVIEEAQANFVGGHSIDDDTLKFGLSVTGLVHPDKVWTNAKAEVGDTLILTKSLGTGTMTAALKRREANEDDIGEALRSMSQINNVVDFLSEELVASIHAATDITGFGISGHSMQMANASQVSLRFQFSSLPRFSRAMDFLERGILTKAHRSNLLYTEASCAWNELKPGEVQLLHDPQTSGGLLLSVRKEKADEIVRQLKPYFPATVIVGEVRAREKSAVIFDGR